jgi:glutaredoxin
MNNTTTISIVLATVLIAGGLIGYEQHKITKDAEKYTAMAAKDTKYLGFAQCLKEKGATFYGAEWCPHCKAQKKAFASAAKELPYVECAIPDGAGGYKNEMTQACVDAQVQSFPTWTFADGSRLSGEVPMATLAEKSGCVLPQ